ncbi:MAG: hypothetical protein PUC12_12275 [Clostridiales bacterium]|nr:hypothetical protein [Clostridiales bacterium]
MSTWSRIRFAVKECFSNMIGFLGIWIMLGASLVLICFSFLFYDLTYHARREYKQVLASPVEDCGLIRMDGDAGLGETFDFGAKGAFLEEVLRIDGVTSVGSIEETGGFEGDSLSELIEIQKDHKHNPENENDQSLEIVEMDKGIFNFCKVDLIQGTLPSETDYGKNKNLMYLGYGYYGKIELGTQYDISNEQYVVAGFFEKGNDWIKPNCFELLLGNMSINEDSDYGVYLVKNSDNVYSNTLYFSIRNGEERDQIRQQFYQLAEKYNLDISVRWLDGALASYEGKMKAWLGYILQLAVLMGSISVVILLCVQTMGILARFRQYGIFYSNGASTMDLLAITLMDNLIKMLVSLMTACPVVYMFGKMVFVSLESEADAFKQLLLKMVYPQTALAALGILLCSSIIPCVMLYRSSPVEMIGGNAE